MRKLMIYGGFMFLMVCLSCSKSNDNPSIRASHYDQERSHNFGMNCMDCHGNFTIGGSVAQMDLTSPYPNSTIYLFDTPDGLGDTLAAIEVDGKGNFYTNQRIDFNDLVYAAVTGNDTMIFKEIPVKNGACNSCHNQINPPIWTK